MSWVILVKIVTELFSDTLMPSAYMGGSDHEKFQSGFRILTVFHRTDIQEDRKVKSLKLKYKKITFCHQTIVISCIFAK
jgi:hypothetical protein